LPIARYSINVVLTGKSQQGNVNHFKYLLRERAYVPRGGLEQEIKEVRCTVTVAPTLEEKLNWQKQQRELEQKAQQVAPGAI